MAEERRLVSVLFADVFGSSGLAETIDPEDVRELLGRFYAIARESVAAHGGTLEKFIGDAVMAIFGVPRAHDDDAVRAVRTALELRDRVREDPALGARLPIRLGVSTGEVVASTDPSKADFIVTGDAVNAAARLQQTAAPWEILATERAARAARAQFRFGDSRAVEARGRREPLLARPVLGAAPPRPARRTRFVGRQVDLDQLELAARRAFLTSRPSLVTVIAGPGAGKTRLIEEFATRRLPRVDSRAAVATACCTSYGQRVTHEPLRALLIALLGLDEQLDPASLRGRTRDWLTVCGDADPIRHAEFLTASTGSAEGEIADRGALFAAWRGAIELAARQRPLVLVLEDLHWASDTILDLLEFVLEPAASTPLLVVVLARPELLDRRPGWGGGRANSIVLGLEPLGRPEMRRLVISLSRGDSPAMIDRIVDRAEGNPFFAEELVRAASERPAAGNLETDLPDSVQGTILARLDLLDPEARRMLQVGAVLGRRFALAAVASMDPHLAPALEAGATTIARRDLVVRVADGALAFRHALIQEVAYQTLPRAERASLHDGASRWLEAEAGGREDQVAELIALHLVEAVEIERAAGHGPDPELRRRAIAWSRRAGEVAHRAAASIEAVGHVRRAIALAGDTATPDLYELAGDVLVAGDAAVEAYGRARESASHHGWSVDDRLRLLAKEITVHARWQGAVARRVDRAAMKTLVSDAEALLLEASDDRAIATYLIGRGFLPFWHAAGGERVEVDPSEVAGVTRGLRIAERLRDPLLQSAALDALAGIAQSQGRHREARERAGQRIGFEDRLDLNERLDAYAFYAWESSLLGEFAEAVTMTRRAVELIEPDRAPTAALHAVAWRAFALAMLGEWDDSVATAARAEALWSGAGRLAAGYAAQGFLAAAEVSRARRDVDGLARWRAILEEVCGPFARGSFARTPLAIVRDDEEEVREAIVHPVALVERPHFVDRALARCADAGWPLPDLALDALEREATAQKLAPLLAGVIRARGLQRRDRTDLGAALEIATRIGALPLAARLHVELGVISGEPALVEEGRRRLDRLGDRTPLAVLAQPV